MMAESLLGTPAAMRCAPCGRGAWADMLAAVHSRFGWTEDTLVYVYCETASSCTLHQARLADAAPGPVPIEGRVFAESGELRWRAVENGSLFQGWLTDETDGDAVLHRDRQYFLLGRGDIEGGYNYSEGRYPEKVFHYPVAVPPGDPANARAFIRVREYFRPEPTEWPGGPAAMTELLNQPMLIGHRFLSVGVTQ